MMDVVSKLLKINLRVKTASNVKYLLNEVLNGDLLHDRGSDTIGEFNASTFEVAGVMFDVVVPSSSETPLGKVIEKHGEGIDSICFAVESLEYTKKHLESRGIQLSREAQFKENKVGFVHPRDACGVGLEFIEGSLAIVGE